MSFNEKFVNKALFLNIIHIMFKTSILCSFPGCILLCADRVQHLCSD